MVLCGGRMAPNGYNQYGVLAGRRRTRDKIYKKIQVAMPLLHLGHAVNTRCKSSITDAVRFSGHTTTTPTIPCISVSSILAHA